MRGRRWLVVGLTVLLLLSAGAAAKRQPMPPVPVPDAPRTGNDYDGDGLPRNVTVETWNYSFPSSGPSRTPGERYVLDVDADDHDRASPVPTWHFRCASGSTGPCMELEADDKHVFLDSSVYPGYECKTGRITLCWYWSPAAHVSYEDRHDSYASREASVGPYVLLP